MSNKNSQIFIQDACVLFDLIDLNLFEIFFQLGLTIVTTEAVINEIADETQLDLVNQKITLNRIMIDKDADDSLIFKFYEHYAGLSFADCSILELAIRKNGILLSSDKSLRNISVKLNIEVHGLLWIIILLVDNDCLTKEDAIEKLKEYMKINLRAPQKEILKLITNLSKP